MHRLALARILGALAAAVLASSAGADLYKWVDEKGVTNYGAAPPANARNVQKIDESSPRVSTVPGLKPEEVQAGENRALQQKADQLERDRDAQRRATADAQARADADARWREQCLADRRIDCDDPSRGRLEYDPGWGPYPPVIVPPPKPPRPIPPRPGPRPTPR
jgi:hypothetical protein